MLYTVSGRVRTVDCAKKAHCLALSISLDYSNEISLGKDSYGVAYDLEHNKTLYLHSGSTFQVPRCLKRSLLHQEVLIHFEVENPDGLYKTPREFKTADIQLLS